MDKFNILDKGSVNILHTIFTGEALAYNVVNKWKKFGANSHIYNAYGPTENTVWNFIYKCNEYTENELINGLVPIGEPLSDFEYIIEGNNNEGELYTYGPQVAKGYWKNEEKTSNTFIKRNNKIWYKSGDWVIKNRRNQVVYINRIDNQVQVNGYRVEIGEIEFKAKELFNTDLIAVVPNQKEDGLIELILFITSKDKDEKMLLASLNKVLPPYMVPNSIKVLDSIPINNSGKIDRIKLKQMI
jgi:acyl-coenzyme A synthetase/AMP-(fatty) acid ligase